jgi:hypothetical protein
MYNARLIDVVSTFEMDGAKRVLRARKLRHPVAECVPEVETLLAGKCPTKWLWHNLSK